MLNNKFTLTRICSPRIIYISYCYSCLPHPVSIPVLVSHLIYLRRRNRADLIELFEMLKGLSGKTGDDLLIKKVKKVNFKIYIADRKTTTCIYAKLFLPCCVNHAALPLVRCYSICPPRRVASWVNYSSRPTESSSEHFASDLSLLKADAPWCESSGARIQTHDLWIRKRLCYPLHHSNPQIQIYLNMPETPGREVTLSNIKSTTVAKISQNSSSQNVL